MKSSFASSIVASVLKRSASGAFVAVALIGTCFLFGCKAHEYYTSSADFDYFPTEKIYEFNVFKMLMDGRFAELDAMAESLRMSRKHVPNSTRWELLNFYTGLTYPDKYTEYGGWEGHIEKFREWVRANPNSITARIGLAEMILEYGWAFRGGDWAKNVSKENWDLFNSKLNEAQQILNDARALKVMCPEWYIAMQDVALGQGWDRDRYDTLFEQAISFEPDYLEYYENKAQYLLPIWNGTNGEWEQFAEEIQSRIGGKKGLAIYWDIFFSIGQRFYPEGKLFSDTDISWEKFLQGYSCRDEIYGVNARSLNRVCQLACYAGDKKTAKTFFEYISANKCVVRDVWKSRDNYLKAKEWALD